MLAAPVVCVPLLGAWQENETGMVMRMWMHMRRFTRLTNAHSKKFVNHCHMVALYIVWYNFMRISLAVKMSPAMAAGISDTLWKTADIVKLIEDAEPA